MKIDPLSLCPEEYLGMRFSLDVREAVGNYLKYGWEPGGFVSSMLAMDMQRALYTADLASRNFMWAFGRWIVENAPAGSYGSYDNIYNWQNNVNSIRSVYREEIEKEYTWSILKDEDNV